MEINLIPPMMMRLAGIKVNECPKSLSDAPSINDHCTYFPEYDIRILFQLEGIISYIPTRKPNAKELKSEAGEYLSLTPNTQDWDPCTTVYRDQEYLATDYNDQVKSIPPKKHFISSIDSNAIVHEYEVRDVCSSPTHFICAISTLPTSNYLNNNDVCLVSGELLHKVDGVSSTKKRNNHR